MHNIAEPVDQLLVSANMYKSRDLEEKRQEMNQIYKNGSRFSQNSKNFADAGKYIRSTSPLSTKCHTDRVDEQISYLRKYNIYIYIYFRLSHLFSQYSFQSDHSNERRKP